MNVQFIVGIVVLAFGVVMMAMGNVWAVIFVIAGAILARMSSKEFIASKIREGQEAQAAQAKPTTKKKK